MRAPFAPCAVLTSALAVLGPGFLHGTTGAAATVATSKPTRLIVSWNEQRALDRGHVIFRVRAIEFGARGWNVRGGFTNRSPFVIRISRGSEEGAYARGVAPVGMSIVQHRTMFTPAGVTHRASVFSGTRFRPRIPPSLRPGESWNGTFGGADRLPPNRYLRVGFGHFIYVGDQPHRFSWITDGGFTT